MIIFFDIMIGTNRGDCEGRGRFIMQGLAFFVGIVYFRKKILREKVGTAYMIYCVDYVL